MADQWSLQAVLLWQLRKGMRMALLMTPFLMAGHHWDARRLWVDGPRTDAFLQEVLAERETRSGLDHPQPAREIRGLQIRCFVPAHASLAALSPHLKAADLANASAWLRPAWPWLGSDWWLLDVVDRRIMKMSRMDKQVLQPHPTLTAAQCVRTNAMRLINTGVNAQGLREFQVIDLALVRQ